jgi:hypothetical protein
VVIFLLKHVTLLFRSKVFLALLVFVGINLCAIVLSDTPSSALSSFSSFCANISVAMATALILLKGKVELTTLKKIILVVTLVSVLWGLLQIIAYRFTGVVLALSPGQIVQIKIGFGPAFRTEANTFGKYMVFPFLLFLPDFIEHRTKKYITLIFLVFVVGILMNFTRSAIYGMFFVVPFIFFWYARSRKLSLLTQKSMKLTAAIALLLALMLGGFLNMSEYGLYKIENFFNQEEVFEGGSSGFRLQMMKLVVDDALRNTSKMIIGNGWGQTHVYYNGLDIQAGGGDIVNVLGFSGLFGVFSYLFYMLITFISVRKSALTSFDDEKRKFAEGLMFALVGVFFTSQFSGYLISPEYWLIIGLGIYLSVQDESFKPREQSGAW